MEHTASYHTDSKAVGNLLSTSAGFTTYCDSLYDEDDKRR